jgi:beta-mannosidase
LASETGYHGCPSPESLKKYIRPEQLYPITDDAGHTKEDWMVKASAMELREGAPYTYRIPLMTSQVQTMFGAIPDTLEQYAKLSQISQAEANKYFIERFRIGKWKRTGILWWNLLDGCPQISDAVVDYYFVKKLAYSYIKRAQAPVCMMMDESQDNVRRLVAVNDTPKDCQLHYTVRDVYTNESVSEGTAMAKADSAVTVAILPAPEDEDRFYLIEWDSEDGVIGKNHYMTKSRELCADRVLNAMTICGLDAFEGFS